MPSAKLHVVTGAFGYTGRYIAQRLLEGGSQVKTLTGRSRGSNPFSQQIAVAPLDFNDPDRLARNLDGVDTLYNTYWIRLSRGEVNFDSAVENSNTLIRAAARAGVKRIVQISITNASTSSRLPYFRGKGLVEDAVRESGLGYGIVRPTLVFGKEDILLNNIAWALRRFPVFPVPGSGDYRIQPVFVGDVARIAVDLGEAGSDQTLDAVGPDVFSFREVVRLIASQIGRQTWVPSMPRNLYAALMKGVGAFVRDVVLTGGEIDGLMQGLLVSRDIPTGEIRLEDWLDQNSDTVGRRYASELGRHYR